MNGGVGKGMKFNKIGLFAVVLILLTGMAQWAWADDEEVNIGGAKQSDFIKERSYIGAIGTSADIDQWGDFNGTNVFTALLNSGAVTEQDIIPSITRQFGWGVLLGHREGPWAAEVSFWRSDHTATFTNASPTITTPASFAAINIDFKHYFFTQFPTQPFINIGVSFPWLWVRQGSFLNSASSSGVNDETISGIGLNLGVGVELYLDNDFSLLGGLYQRWTEFDQINGAAKIPLNQMYFDGNSTDIGSLAGNGLNIYVGGTFGVE
jgi:hypothetical protein